MPYHYEKDIAIADIAFEARGRSVEELFTAAADATMNVMVENIDDVEPREEIPLAVSAIAYDFLLFNFLQELIFFKDAHQLLLRVRSIAIWTDNDTCFLAATAAGEIIDPERHRFRADVKAVTMHRLSVEMRDDEWVASVVLDI